MLDKISKLDVRRCFFVPCGVGVPGTGDICARPRWASTTGEYPSMSAGLEGMRESEADMGRGERCSIVSRLCSWACWCRIVCFMLDIWFRMDTAEVCACATLELL